MPEIDQNQREFAESVENDIRNSISNDVGKDKAENSEKDSGSDGGDVSRETAPKNDSKEKKVEKPAKKSDNKSDDLGNLSESELFDATVSKIITDEFDGDESKRDAAKSIANVAIKTFNGDPIKAAKSYKSLFDQTHQIKSLIKNNPFIDKLVNEARNGKQVDENYAKELLGTATSNADEPIKKNTTQSVDELSQAEIDDFDPDALTVDELVESGSLDKTKYEAASSIDKRDMLEKAKIRHSYKVLPQKMAERSVQLAQKKSQEKTRQEKLDNAKATNKERLQNNIRDFVTKYDVDFDNNPEHAQLYEDIYKKAVRLPDIDDESGMLIAEDAFERAAKHVFSRNGIELGQASVTTNDGEDPSEDPIDRVTSNSADIMRRILSGANGFNGKASSNHKVQRKSEDENAGDDLNSRVNNRISEQLNRSYQTTKMISGVRKVDRQKT